MLKDLSGTRERLADEIESAWTTLIQPDWPLISRVLEDDIAYRGQQLTDGGLAALFDDLHPTLTWEDDRLIATRYREPGRELTGQGSPPRPRRLRLAVPGDGRRPELPTHSRLSSTRRSPTLVRRPRSPGPTGPPARPHPRNPARRAGPTGNDQCARRTVRTGPGNGRRAPVRAPRRRAGDQATYGSSGALPPYRSRTGGGRRLRRLRAGPGQNAGSEQHASHSAVAGFAGSGRGTGPATGRADGDHRTAAVDHAGARCGAAAATGVGQPVPPAPGRALAAMGRTGAARRTRARQRLLPGRADLLPGHRRRERRHGAGEGRVADLGDERGRVRGLVLGGGPGRAVRPGARARARGRAGRPAVPADDGRPAGLGALAARIHRLPVRRVHRRDRVQPDRHDAADRPGEDADGDPVGHLAAHHRGDRGPRGERALKRLSTEM